MPRKSTLNREQIIEVTLRLAQSSSPTALSYRRIAAELKVDPAALYRYFADKHQLVCAAVDQLWEQVLESLDPSLSWRARLEQLARICFDIVTAHPGVGIDVGHLVTGGPGEFGLIEFILEAMSDAGLKGPDVAEHYAVFAAALLSLASTQAAIQVLEGESSRGIEEPWLTDRITVDPRSFPLVHKHASNIENLTHLGVLLRTTESILDQITVVASPIQ